MATRPIPMKGVAPFDAVAGFSPTNPTATGTGTDASFAFLRQARSVGIQNNTAAALYANFDAAASPGTWLVAAGQTIFFDVPCTTVHLYTAAATNVNGGAAGAIVLGGWL